MIVTHRQRKCKKKHIYAMKMTTERCLFTFKQLHAMAHVCVMIKPIKRYKNWYYLLFFKCLLLSIDCIYFTVKYFFVTYRAFYYFINANKNWKYLSVVVKPTTS